MNQRLIGVCLVTVSALAVVLAGCDLEPAAQSPMQGQAQRVQKLSYPMSKNAVLDVEAANGTIVVTGGGGNDCQVTAGVVVQASSQHAAQDLASRVRIATETTKDGLQIRSDAPLPLMGQTIAVNYEIALPASCGLTAKTGNGAVVVNTLAGPVKITCTNGNVTIRDCTGSVLAKADNGPINATGLKSDCDLKSGNGGVLALYGPNTQAATNIHIASRNGGIELQPPKQLSAALDLSARNGTIRCAWPLKMSLLDKHQKGTLGKGDAKVVLATENGSIVVRE